MKTSHEDYTNSRAKLWREVGPFYLDYFESAQLPYFLSDIQWLHSSEPPAHGHHSLNILFAAQSEQNSFLSVIKVLYPEEETEVSPADLLNFNRYLTSLPACKAYPQREVRTKALYGVENQRFPFQFFQERLIYGSIRER